MNVRLRDASSGEPQATLSGHDGFADIDVSMDGRYLVTADGTTARAWPSTSTSWSESPSPG